MVLANIWESFLSGTQNSGLTLIGYEPFCTVTKSTMLFKICLRDFRKRGTKEVTSKLEKWHKALPTLLLCNHQPKHLYTIYQKGIAYYFHHCNPSGCYHSHPRGASCSAISRGYRQSHGHAYPTSNTPIMQPPTKTLVYHIPEGDCILFFIVCVRLCGSCQCCCCM